MRTTNLQFLIKVVSQGCAEFCYSQFMDIQCYTQLLLQFNCMCCKKRSFSW